MPNTNNTADKTTIYPKYSELSDAVSHIKSRLPIETPNQLEAAIGTLINSTELTNEEEKKCH